MSRKYVHCEFAVLVCLGADDMTADDKCYMIDYVLSQRDRSSDSVLSG